jgi:transcription elongation factor Elf1
MSKERNRHFPCTHCRAECPYPEDVVQFQYGRVGVHCRTCGKMFDIEMPPKETLPLD